MKLAGILIQTFHHIGDKKILRKFNTLRIEENYICWILYLCQNLINHKKKLTFKVKKKNFFYSSSNWVFFFIWKTTTFFEGLSSNVHFKKISKIY
jgi:hypothetical protein